MSPRQMLLDELLLNPSVETADEPRLYRQAVELLRLFEARERVGLPVSTVDLRKIGCQYNSRLSEVRRYLVRTQFRCIDLVRKGTGRVNYYAIVPCENSDFYREHKDTL